MAGGRPTDGLMANDDNVVNNGSNDDNDGSDGSDARTWVTLPMMLHKNTYIHTYLFMHASMPSSFTTLRLASALVSSNAHIKAREYK